MKKFKVTVTRTIEYEVEVDENLWGVEQRENFQNTFWDLDPTSYAGNNENVMPGDRSLTYTNYTD